MGIICVPVKGQPHFIQMHHVVRMFAVQPGMHGHLQCAIEDNGKTCLHLSDGTLLVLDISFEDFQEKFLQVPKQQSNILVPQPQSPFGL